MIHTSLPLRPRTSGRIEHLVTPLSIYSGKNNHDVIVLSLTTINLLVNSEEVIKEYVELIERTIGSFAIVFKDNDPLFKDFIIDKINYLNFFEENCNVTTCQCGEYEEVTGTRMFNLSKVDSNICKQCNTELFNRNQKLLFLNIPWLNFKEKFSHNKKWVKKDFDHFLNKQKNSPYKISKQSERLRINAFGSNYGIKYRILWAMSIVYLSDRTNENSINLHFVHQVSSIAFFVACLASLIKPSLDITLSGLPSIWLPHRLEINQCSNTEITKLKKGLQSKRKDIHV